MRAEVLTADPERDGESPYVAQERTMPFGKSAEQKEIEAREREQREAAARAEKEQREAAARAERERREFRASPVGQAIAAKEQGQGFFEIQLLVGSSQRDTSFWGGDTSADSNVQSQSHAGTLAAIESAGWRLEHVGHVFVVTGESSREKFLLSGQQVDVSGETIGIYLFRNVD